MTVTILIVDVDSAEYLQGLPSCHSDLELRGVRTADEALSCCADANVLVAMAHHVTQELIDAMPGLRWIQALTTGVDHLATLQLPPSLLVTTARGVHGPQMSELALFTMMALIRNLRGMLDNQSHRRWERWPQPVLVDKTAVIVGVGTIGEELAIRCAAFGMRVIGVSASRTEAPAFDAIMPQTQIAQAAAQADFLILLLPYTSRSHHLVNATVLAAMQPHAMVINLARGGVVDEQALIAALAERRIAGAGLDVFEVEPLPPESPLWAMDNVIITPHIGGMSDTYARQVSPLLIDNTTNFAAGRLDAMRNVIS